MTSLLLEEIQDIDKRAAGVFKQADLHTDSDIQVLTREELRELFPGVQDFKLRRKIFDAIHKQRPVELLLKKLKGFIPSESFRAALTDNGVLVDYLRILKDMKTQTNNVQSFLEAHISLLEEFSNNQPGQDSAKRHVSEADCGPASDWTTVSLPDMSNNRESFHGCPVVAQGSGNADASGKTLQIGTTGGHPPEPPKSWSGPSTPATSAPVKRPGGAQGTPDIGDPVGRSTGRTGGHPPQVTQPTLYKMVVSGKTFDTHLELMKQVKKSVQNQIQLCEGNQDNKITFVFCPISSRIASDVEAALTDFTDKKPVILVLMHHSREVKPTSPMRTWPDDKRVMLHVNVFYHETVGLLRCDRNDDAVTEIQNKLLEQCYVQRSKDTSGNAQGGGTDHGGAGNWRTWLSAPKLF